MGSYMGKVWGVLLMGVLAWGTAWGAEQDSRPGVPGTVNYVEGQVSLDGRELDAKAIGSITLEPGQSLSTGAGKAEVLLTPGVFFRIGDNSTLRMIAAGLTNTEVELERGRAMAEVAEIHPENNLHVIQNGMNIRLEKTGLYEFDRDGNTFRTFEGKAGVEEGNHHRTVKAKHQLSTAEDNVLVAQKFDRNKYASDDLYNWSSLRSAYLAEANVNEASYYNQNGWMPGGPMWWGAGWYWDPWFDAFTYMPGDGIFYSPFGWGFYSPWYVSQAPMYGYGYRTATGQIYHHFSANAQAWGPGTHYTSGQHYARGIYRGPGSMRGGFHSGGRMVAGPRFGSFGGRGGFHGGGFHGGGGGGGGFHGGGFGGGGSHGGGSIGGHGH